MLKLNSTLSRSTRSVPHHLPVGLWSLGLGLWLWHLTLLWKLTAQADELILNTLLWLAIGVQIRRRAKTLCWNSPAIASLIGGGWLGLLAIRSLGTFGIETGFVRLFPMLGMMGLGLLASGWRITQYWREFGLMLPWMLPTTPILEGLDHGLGPLACTVTAQGAAFLLHYLGIPLAVDQSTITLSTGSVTVEFACTALPSLWLLLKVAVLFRALFPLNWRSQLTLFAIISLMTLGTSLVRVGILAVFVHQPTLFNAWHGSTGTQWISTVLVVALGGLQHRFHERHGSRANPSPH